MRKKASAKKLTLFAGMTKSSVLVNKFLHILMIRYESHMGYNETCYRTLV